MPIPTNTLRPIDKLLVQCEHMLRSLAGTAEGTNRPSPDQLSAQNHSEKNPQTNQLTLAQKRHIAGLMRVNHSGEIMAQALYFGQLAVLSSNDPLVHHLHRAAQEEADHLGWCKACIDELGGHTSLLNPVWYVGAFFLGSAAGALGTGYSLGFIAEVEAQVHTHLATHIAQLPPAATQTRAVLIQMQKDEDGHREQALEKGGKPLPMLAKAGLTTMSKIMTKLAYRM